MVISSPQLLQTKTRFQTPDSLSEHLKAYLKSCNSETLTLKDVSASRSFITSESIASSLFNDLDFSKAMSLIGLTSSNYQTDPLK